jgi:hypothetical protein
MLANWQRGMAAAGPAYVAGTSNPSVNPMLAAATPEAMQSYLTGVQQSVASGKRAAALQNTPLSKYTTACKTKGAAALAAGAQLGGPAYSAAMQTWAPIYAQASAAAKAIPKVKGSVANAMQRIQASLAVMMGQAPTH